MLRLRTHLLLAALVLAGCGGDEAGPGLESRLAQPLAAQADRVAAALEAGDSCAAARAAARLQEQTKAAVNSGEVPPALQEELMSAVNRLASEVECLPPPAPPVVETERPKKHKKKKHDEEKGDD
jgi:hypothetical protein